MTTQDWISKLASWREFYAFAGGAAATLMGLMFVVVSLGQRTLATEEGTRATRSFFTPIVAFFATVIVVTLLMLIPDVSPGGLGLMLGAVAAGGIAYMLASGAHSMWRSSELGFEDLMWYVVLPYASYLVIGVAAVAIWKQASFGLQTAAAAMLLLLLIGIRNAWDLVIYNIQRGQ